MLKAGSAILATELCAHQASTVIDTSWTNLWEIATLATTVQVHLTLTRAVCLTRGQAILLSTSVIAVSLENGVALANKLAHSVPKERLTAQGASKLPMNALTAPWATTAKLQV